MTHADRPSPRTAVVVVNHNTRDDLLTCLDSLGDAGADEIVVVDSGSSDGSLTAVSQRHPDVQRVALPNLGFGRSANVGVRKSAADVVVVTNADTVFTP
ncbi:MAG: glycosyltransferase, partial [Actinomycetota bacterium]